MSEWAIGGGRSALGARRRRGQPPSALTTLWNLASVAWQRRAAPGGRRLEGRLRHALETRTRPFGEQDRLALGRGMRRGVLTADAAAALAALGRGFDERPGHQRRLEAGDLLQAWRMLNGGVVLSPEPQGPRAALDLATLAAAAAGRYVLRVASLGEVAEDDAWRLSTAVARLGLRLSIVSGDMERRERREAYRADIVYLELGTLAMDLLRDAQGDQRRAAGMRRRLGRLGGTQAERLLAERPTLALCHDAGAVLCDRALENNALRAPGRCSDEPALAEQVLDLASLLREGDHFVLSPPPEAARLTEVGRSVLATMAMARGGLLADETLRETGVARALLVRHGLRPDRDYTLSGGHVRVLDAALAERHADPDSPPGLQALLECHCATRPAPGMIRSQARNQQLLAGSLDAIGGYALALPGLAHELVRLYDVAVWHPVADPPARPATAGLEAFEAPDGDALAALVQDWRETPGIRIGWVLPEGEAIPGAASRDEVAIPLSRLLDTLRYDLALAELEGVSHLLLAVGEDADPFALGHLVSRRLPGLAHCRVAVLRSLPGRGRRLASGALSRSLAGWRRRRLLVRRTRLKRRLLLRDETLQRLTQFSGESGS